MSKNHLNNNQLTTAISEAGLGNQPWWVEQWMELINSYHFKKRLERAWAYAREGNVISIRFEGRRVHARVQGTDEDPYRVKLWLEVLSEEDWSYVLEALNQKAKWSAQLLAGIMPSDIERAFASSGRRLFPFKLQEIRSECSCPDKANPCKHISAIYYLMGDRFSEDPFVLFQLRGRTRTQLLNDLAEKRRQVLAKREKNVKTDHLKNSNKKKEARHKSHPATLAPDLWWKYENNLNKDLVVITPALEGETGIDAAGDLPLAEEPKFPEGKKRFIAQIKQHGKSLAQKAMIQAMSDI